MDTDPTTAGWSACNPIVWYYDTTGLNDKPGTVIANELKKVRTALRIWSNASGLTFTEGGPLDTTLVPKQFASLRDTNGDPLPNGSITIAWADKTTYPRFRTGILGVGGAGLITQNARTREWTIDYGWALINTGTLWNRTNDGRTSLYLHEIGHALGMPHGLGVMRPALVRNAQPRLTRANTRMIQQRTQPCPVIPAPTATPTPGVSPSMSPTDTANPTSTVTANTSE